MTAIVYETQKFRNDQIANYADALKKQGYEVAAYANRNDALGALRPAAAQPGGGVPTTGVPGRAPAPPAPAAYC